MKLLLISLFLQMRSRRSQGATIIGPAIQAQICDCAHVNATTVLVCHGMSFQGGEEGMNI